MAEALAFPAGRPVRTAHADPRSAPSGSVTGGVRLLLRLEGLVVLAGAVATYAWFGAGWGWFAALFLVPDLSFLAYLAGPRWGAAAYNAAHSHVGAVALLVAGVLGGFALALAAALVWCAHIGFDRMLGYGLKYGSGFHDTHLGRLGRADPW